MCMRRIYGSVFAAFIFLIGNNVSYGCESSPLNTVENWMYQLQASDPRAISTTNFDMAVVDYSRDGSQEMAFSREDVAQMKIRENGCPRLVLAYMSIGEAEDYRYYWQSEWSARKPDWMQAENDEWSGNYVIDFWEAEWKEIIFGSPTSYLDRIIAAGFDGVYLDRVDVRWERRGDRASSEEDMINFVRDLSAYAKVLNPEFLLVPQNAEGLLEVKKYLEVIDRIATESLFFLPGKSGERLPADEFEYSYNV